MILLLSALEAQRRRGGSPALIGLLFGLAFHGPLLAWIIAPAGFVGWSLLVAVQVVWYVVLAVLASTFVPSRWVILATPAVWVGIDAWRSSIPLGGFAWGSIEYTQIDNGWLLPVARLAGGRALAFMTVLLAAAAYEAGRRVVDATRDEDGTIRPALLRATLPQGNFGAGVLVGSMLLVVLVTVQPPPAIGTADVLVVQGNDIEDWFGSGLQLDETIATTMLDETRQAIGNGPVPDLTIWPESSIDRDPTRSDATVIADQVAAAAAVTQGRLIAGVNQDGPRPRTFLNSAVQFGADGRPVDRYVKRRLVPFGEYVPFRSLLEWFPPLRQVPRDGIGGAGPHILAVGNVRAAVTICFETMFPRVVRSNVSVMVLTPTFSWRPPTTHRSVAAPNPSSTSRRRGCVRGDRALGGPCGGLGSLDVHRPVRPRRCPHGPVHRDAHPPRRAAVAGRTPYLATGDWVGVLVRAAAFVMAAFALARRTRR